LEQEFDRFGAIKRLQFVEGEALAYIEYDSMDAAKAAVAEMRGYPLGGADHRLRIDYADLDEESSGEKSQVVAPAVLPPGTSPERERDQKPETATTSSAQVIDKKPETSTSELRSITEISRTSEVAWKGAVVLKNSLFTLQMHQVEGDANFVTNFVRDTTSSNGHKVLKVTQRLRLDPVKLDEVERSLGGYAAYGIFLALPCSGMQLVLKNDEGIIQQRPFRNLVAYLRSKQAAGVISLNYSTSSSVVMDAATPASLIYLFPPCDFTARLLHRQSPGIDDADPMHRDCHLIVVAVANLPA
jgi:RNA-binding protein 15